MIGFEWINEFGAWVIRLGDIELIRWSTGRFSLFLKLPLGCTTWIHLHCGSIDKTHKVTIEKSGDGTVIPAPGVCMTRKRKITIVAIPVKGGPPFHHWEVDGANVGVAS